MFVAVWQDLHNTYILHVCVRVRGSWFVSSSSPHEIQSPTFCRKLSVSVLLIPLCFVKFPYLALVDSTYLVSQLPCQDGWIDVLLLASSSTSLQLQKRNATQEKQAHTHLQLQANVTGAYRSANGHGSRWCRALAGGYLSFERDNVTWPHILTFEIVISTAHAQNTPSGVIPPDQATNFNRELSNNN